MKLTLWFPSGVDDTGPVPPVPSWSEHMRQEVEDLKAEMALEFPGFRIVPKTDSELMHLLNLVLFLLTAGTLRTFMTSFTTIIGRTMYTPDGWESRGMSSQLVTLRHERVHLRQQRRYSRPLFTFLYLFVLPFGFAYFRTKFEKEAYEESMLVSATRYGTSILREKGYRERMIENFTSGSYMWMWVRRADIEKWYDEAATNLEKQLHV